MNKFTFKCNKCEAVKIRQTTTVVICDKCEVLMHRFSKNQDKRLQKAKQELASYGL